jgi:excisionase family DNA binding protein
VYFHESPRQELTIQDAARMLGVSEGFVQRVLDEGQIPSRKTGEQRGVRTADLIAWKRHTDDARLRALAQLQKQAQELDMGY